MIKDFFPTIYYFFSIQWNIIKIVKTWNSTAVRFWHHFSKKSNCNFKFCLPWLRHYWIRPWIKDSLLECTYLPTYERIRLYCQFLKFDDNLMGIFEFVAKYDSWRNHEKLSLLFLYYRSFGLHQVEINCVDREEEANIFTLK